MCDISIFKTKNLTPPIGEKNISSTKFSRFKEPEKVYRTIKKLCRYRQK